MTTHRSGRRRRRLASACGAVIAGLVGALVGSYVHTNVTSLGRGMDRVRAAGFATRRATVSGHRLSYLQGPDNGPPLVLVHGQASASEDAMKVLVELAADHQVFAVDVPGHGHSDRLPPEHYTAVFVGDLLAEFVDRVTDGPALVSGHSSGGLLALHVAATRPELVAGLLLEDPPLFSSEPDRIDATLGGVLPRLATAYRDEGEPGGDFQRYYLEHADYFALFGPLADWLTERSVAWVDRHPGEPLGLAYLPPLVTVFFLGMVNYDPGFGEAWGRPDGWYAGFDTEAALRAVEVPTTLLHTNYFEHRDGSAYQDGVLMAAMDGDDVARALDLLPADTQLVEVQSGHLVHFEQPEAYLAAAHDLTDRID